MPRPPPTRAITGCCTCSPRPTSHRSSRTIPTSPASSSPSASTPASSPSAPPHSQPFTTSSTRPAAPAALLAASGPAPVLDFLYPGFGFFSRSLPPLVAVGPPPLVPSPISATSTKRVSYLHKSRSAGLTNWNSVRVVVPGGGCGCGRIRETCLRCRGNSSSSAQRASLAPPPAVAIDPPLDKGKEKLSKRDSVNFVDPVQPDPTTPSRLESFRALFSRLDRTLPSSRTSITSSPRPEYNPSHLSSTRRRLHRKRSNLVAQVVAHERGSPVRSPADADDPMTRLSEYLETPEVWHALTEYEKLDSIRFFSRIAHLVDRNPSSSSSSSWLPNTIGTTTTTTTTAARRDVGLIEEPSSSSLVSFLSSKTTNMTTSSGQDQDQDRDFDHRVRASERIQHFLEKLELELELEEDARGPGSPPTRPPGRRRRRNSHSTAASTRSRAGLWIESFALRGDVSDLEIPDRAAAAAAETSGIDIVRDGGREREEIEERGLGRRQARFERAIWTVFDLERQRHDTDNDDERSERSRVQAITSGAASLVESWSRERRDRGGRAAEAALKLVHGYDLEAVLFARGGGNPTTTAVDDDDDRTRRRRRRQDVGYGDVLTRQYGLLLGRLEPSPSQWWETHKDGDDVEKGWHLVEYLARSGSAGEARKVWDAVEHGSVDRALDDRRRLSVLTALVDGLIAAGLYEDANSLTRELEPLANRFGGELGLAANRVLAKLASNQGRQEILERLLAKLDAAPTSLSPPQLALETFARRIRAKAARYDAKAVEALFRSFQQTSEWSDASKEDQARLWSQVIVSQTRINHVEGAVETLRSLVAAGLGPPLAAVNSILFGFARRGEVSTVDSLFHQLVRGDFDRLRPDVASWNALILARTTVKDPSAASRVVVEMRRYGGCGATPDRQTWTTLMAGFVDCSQWRQAFEIYRFLEHHASVDMRPDTATTNVVLKACVLTATPASTVLSLFRQLLVRGFRPNMMTYTLVLQSLTSAGLMDLAEELYLMMDRPSSTFPSPSPSSSPSRESDSSSPRHSESLPIAMTRVRPDKFIFSTLIAGYLQRDEKAKAKVCLAEMRRRGIEPSSITLAIVVGSRLNERSTPHKVQQMVAEARKLLREDDGHGLTRARRSQPARLDRKLATGDEAVAVFAPIFRSAAKQGLAAAALELLEEVQSSRKTHDVPIELYTMLMDAFRRVDDAEAAADNVKAVWDRVYESVAERYITLRTPPGRSTSDAYPPAPLTAHVLTTSRFDFRVDPAQASILSVPLTILLDSLARAERHHVFGTTWRALARQGFSFDASNWNTIALYFARDLQLKRAFWIAEHVLCRPVDDDAPPASPASFVAEFAAVARSSAVTRTPSRLSTLRRIERDRQRKHPIDISTLFSPVETTPGGLDAEGLQVDFSSTFETALRVREASFWHPYGALLEALETALETLTATGELELGADAEGGGRRERVVSAAELKRKLVLDHPRTMEAIALWKTRSERRDREAERFLSLQGRTL